LKETHTDTFPIVVCPTASPFILRQCETHRSCCFFLRGPASLSNLGLFLSLCWSIFSSLQVLVAFISFSETMLLVYLSYKVSETTHVPMALSLVLVLASKTPIIPGENYSICQIQIHCNA